MPLLHSHSSLSLYYVPVTSLLSSAPPPRIRQQVVTCEPSSLCSFSHNSHNSEALLGSGVTNHGPRRFPQLCNITPISCGSFPLTTFSCRSTMPHSRLCSDSFLGAARGAHILMSARPRGELLMASMPGSTVQCMNPLCDSKGRWLRADLLESENCPSCGQALRFVPPPLSPRHHFRPRPLAPRPSFRPR